MDGPPEIVAGMVMSVMTSCSLRPARRAKKPPMAWMPSCELPARRMTVSVIFETFGAPPVDGAATVESLMDVFLVQIPVESERTIRPRLIIGVSDHSHKTLTSRPTVSNLYGRAYPVDWQYIMQIGR